MSRRRSSRLDCSGYYDGDGKPFVSYKETPHRPFGKRRLSNRGATANNGDTSSYTDTDSEPDPIGFTLTDLDTNRYADSLRNSKVFSFFNTKTFAFLCMLLLTFGMGYLIFPDSRPAVSSVPPNDKIFNTPCEDVWQQMRQMQDELLRLQSSINSLLPTADTLPNFALDTLGARVLPHLSSETHQIPSRSSWSLFGMRLWPRSINAWTVIQQGPIVAGRCWPFAGSRGHLHIRLSMDIAISHVTLGHMSKMVSPTGDISHAPKEFSVYGMKTEDAEVKLGTFLYDQDGDSLQTFKVSHHGDGPFRYVKLQVESNWGNSEYTCLYNFRVHGKKAGDR